MSRSAQHRRVSSHAPRTAELRKSTARFWIFLAAALGFSLRPGEARGDDLCQEGPAVELAIELEPNDAALRGRLERQVRAELAARRIHVCSADRNRVVARTGDVGAAVGAGAAVRGEPWLARLRLWAQPPELSRARVWVQTRGGTTLERALSLSDLPSATRPSAIATATDELLATALAEPAGPPPLAPAVADVSPGSGVDEAQAPPPSAPHATSNLVALGVGAAISGFPDSASMYGASLALRLRPLPRLSVTLGVGHAIGQQGLPGAARVEVPPVDESDAAVRRVPAALPDGVRSSIDYAQLDLGFALVAGGPWELSAHAGARVARSTLRLDYAPEVTEGRIGFGEGSESAGFFLPAGDAVPPRGRPTAHGTDLLGSAGLEGRWQTGPWSFSTSLRALVPLLSSYPDDLELINGSSSPRAGHGARLGAELRLGAWFAFGGP